MVNIYKTHNCGELRINNTNEEVRLAGFVQTIRNLSKMMFIDLRDEHGITQIVISDGAGIAVADGQCMLIVDQGEKQMFQRRIFLRTLRRGLQGVVQGLFERFRK